MHPEFPAGQNRMKARTKHLENNSTNGLLKASPTFLGRGFFPLQPFSFLDGACTRQHSQGMWRKGSVPPSSHSPALHSPPLTRKFCFSLTFQAQQYSGLTFNTLFQSQLS